MAYYVVNPDELYHHGIKGQHWGVRRFQNEDGSLKSAGKARYGSADYYQQKSEKHIAKIATSKTRLGKNFHNLMANSHQQAANQQRSLENAKGIKDVVSTLYGHKGAANNAQANAEYYQRKAEFSKTRYGKTINEARAFNAKSYASAANKIANSKSVKEWMNNKWESVANRPVKTWAGRETTTGQAYVDQLLTGGVVGAIQDTAYYRSNKPSK